MEANLADLFELAVDTFGDREYLVADGKRRTYAELEDRANRLAHYLTEHGVQPGDHVGIYAYNCVEWVEALWAIFKVRAVWVNINYRYVADELRYIVDNADLVGLIHAREFGDRLAQIPDALGGLRFRLVIEDGTDAPVDPKSDDYETALSTQSGERDFPPRSGDDLYILYTGGTTGMPKGVVWRHEDVFYALGGGINVVTNEKVEDPGDLARKAVGGFAMTSLPIAPLMHGASQWSVMGGSFQGNRVVLVAKFDPTRVWELVEQEKVNLLFITGDAMARPLIEAIEDAEKNGRTFDTSSLFALASTAAVFSPTVKDQFIDHFPNLVVSDAIGSSETGGNGHVQVQKGAPMKGGPTVHVVSDTVVLDDDLNELPPGTGTIGKVARRGNIPQGYYKDPVKTAETFVTSAKGVRYAMPGDFALLEADGTITLLGRGSVSINSGGEKIYPEEVEAAVKSHPAVWDATVVGVADERWGQRVAAVVQVRDGMALELEDLQAHCRDKIAGYKIPRQLNLVPVVVRSPSGKPDYRWAREAAEA